jgi:DNA polymerase-1
MKTLYILDVSGYLFRSYYAIRQMTNTQGEATNALYGFARSVGKLIKDFNPKHVIAVFDPPNGKESRLKLFNDYKAHRDSAPEDLPHQIEWAKEFCKLYGLPSLEISGFEADDTIATVAKWAEKNDFHVYICSSDKDLCQLVNDKIHILYTHKDNQILDSNGVFEKFGVQPDQIQDYLAITGDSADNVPGLSGFGPKTASKLLQEFKTLKNILDNPQKVPGKKKQETLINERESAELSHKLVALEYNLPIPNEESFYQIKDPENEKLCKFYEEKSFTSLLKEIEILKPTNEISESYTLVNTREKLNELVDTLSKAKEICFDTETTSQYPMLASLVGIGFSIQEGEAWYVPCNDLLSREEIITTLKPIFENPNISFFGHNIKYDLHLLAHYNIEVQSISYDTILASYLLNADSHRHSLDQLSLHYFNKQKISLESLVGKGKKAITIDQAPIEKVSQYCCEDADYTLRLRNITKKELVERNLLSLLEEIELPVMKILFALERKGMYVDAQFLGTLSLKFNADLQRLEKEIHTIAEEEFKINSPKQLSHILFEKLGIHPPKKTATGYSTDAEVLEILKDDYPICEKIARYRQLEKLRSTYIDALPNEINPHTGRIHSTFQQHVAATGRLSSQNPNLQNIPIRTEEGRLVRKGFLPEQENWVYLSADYSQIELRLLAHMSEDPQLIQAFQKGEDIHSYTASLIFDTPIDRVSKEQRYQAKTVNFGILYGQQAFGLAKELGIDRKSASLFIETYFHRYPKVKEFILDSQEEARLSGKSQTLSGRERRLVDINSKNRILRSAAERLAVNSPIQGTAADLIKLAMIAVHRRIQTHTPSLSGYLILQIHDELLFEIPAFEIEYFKSLVIKGMKDDMWDLKVPLEINITVGKNWKEC